MILTDSDRRLVIDHLHIAEMEASRFAGPRTTRGELLSSAYYGLCEAALRRPRPRSFGAIARIYCRSRIKKDLGRRGETRMRATLVYLIERGELWREDRLLDGLIDAESRERLLAALDGLSDRKRQIVQDVLSGQTLISMGPPRTISREYNGAIRILRVTLTC